MKDTFAHSRLETLRPLLCKEISLAALAKDSQVDIQKLRSWLNSLLQGKSLKQVQAGFVLRKDTKQKYLWHNEHAKDLWEKGTSFVGLTDKEVAPNKAAEYRLEEMGVMASGKRKRFTNKVHFCDQGFYRAVADVVPIVDSRGESAGTLILSHIEFNLASQPFPAALRLIRAPRKYGLLRQDSYKFSAKAKIQLSRREAEVSLCSMIGMTAGEIANQMGATSRSVESYLSNVYNKLGVQSRQELVSALLESDFLEKL